MFDESDSADERVGQRQSKQTDKLKVNKNFEARFNEKQRRKELERAQTKYGKGYVEKLGAEDDGEESSSLAEDEEAVLDTEDISMQVLATLSKIRSKNPEIYDPNVRYFDEEKLLDRAEQHLGKRAPKVDQNKMDYRRMVREAVKDGTLALDDEEEDKEDDVPVKKGSQQRKQSKSSQNGQPADSDDETPFQMQQRIKKEFQNAIGDMADAEDGFLTVKKKTKEEVLGEEEAFEKFIKAQKQKSKSDAKEIKKVWGDKEKLSEGDRFLRSFVFTQGWIEKDDDSDAGVDYTHFGTGRVNKVQKMLEEADQEDEERAEEMAKFEEKVNFRFQQPRGTAIQTFERKGSR